MKKRVLMLASVASMIDQFNMPNIRLMKEAGYQVHVACNFKNGNTCDGWQIQELIEILHKMGVLWHQWDCPGNVRSVGQCIRAYEQLHELTGRYCFDWMHCHSPVGGALARVVAHQRRIAVCKKLKDSILYFLDKPKKRAFCGQHNREIVTEYSLKEV